jgi:hypothetical protein
VTNHFDDPNTGIDSITEMQTTYKCYRTTANCLFVCLMLNGTVELYSGPIRGLDFLVVHPVTQGVWFIYCALIARVSKKWFEIFENIIHRYQLLHKVI